MTGKLHSRGYIGKITVNPRFEQDKIVVVGEASSWKSVPQSSGSQEELVDVELSFH